VTVSHCCSSARLVDLVHGKRALVFCDIDGGEFSLFTPDAVEALRGCAVFIELHGAPESSWIPKRRPARSISDFWVRMRRE
jgi:hypothetical protein